MFHISRPQEQPIVVELQLSETLKDPIVANAS